MPLQDLTPQLRTRLSRMERLVAWFIGIAMLALVAALAYYVVHTAERKGWFLEKVDYMTCVNDAEGLKVGDPVTLMGFRVGEIIGIEANDPWDYYNVTVYFRIRKPYYGYLWTDSTARVTSSDFLGNRKLEVTKGRHGVPTVQEVDRVRRGLGSETNWVIEGILDWEYVRKLKDTDADLLELYKKNPDPFYVSVDDAHHCWLDPEETPALMDELGGLVKQARDSMPGLFSLTNQVAAVLDNSSSLTANFDRTLEQLKPSIGNLEVVLGNLTNSNGALGEWLLPPEIRDRVGSVLNSADGTLLTATTTLGEGRESLGAIRSNLVPMLVNLTDITGELRRQVEANSNMLSRVSGAVVQADEFLRRLRTHWLLRSAFDEPKPPPARRAIKPPKPANEPRWR